MKVHRIAGAVLTALVLLPATADAKSEKVCAKPAAGFAACHARVVTDAGGAPAVTTAPNGYGPSNLQSAYNLPSGSGGSGRTIAIVDAYDLPTAQSDLDAYRSTYGLPQRQITKINQTGGSTPPRVNASWGQEIALDLDMASAICPNCNILLVEANSAAFTDLAAAENTAAARGATVISNSYGGPEFSQETTGIYASAYKHSGTPITVSSGDNGYGVEYPAASPDVTAVGGTSLRTASGTRPWTESAWSGAGSGCSAYVAKPLWQHDAGCSRRTVADTSAVADPNTGVAVYDTTKYQGRAGWMVFGGTSVAAPLVAGVYALAGGNTTAAQSLYSSSAFYDVTGGSNGSCGSSYLCTGTAGYDGPTGLGTPNGASAF